jgi:hypothetical protein
VDGPELRPEGLASTLSGRYCQADYDVRLSVRRDTAGDGASSAQHFTGIGPALDLTATVLLGAAFIVTLIVIWLDNVVEPDSAWLATRLARPMIVEDVIDKFVELENMRDQINENWIQGTKIASQVQLLLAGGSSLISLVALLSTHT